MILDIIMVAAIIALAAFCAFLHFRVRRVLEYVYELEDEIAGALGNHARVLKSVREAIPTEQASPAMLTHTTNSGLQPVAVQGARHRPKKAPDPVTGQPLPVRQPHVPDEDGIPITGHCIVVGQSNSGKTNVLMSQIMRRIRAGQRLYIIDTKRELAPIFGPHTDGCYDTEHAAATLDMMFTIADDRQKLFAELGRQHKRPVRDLGEYAEVTGEELPAITLVLEEMVVISKILGKEGIAKLVKLLAFGRAAGVFVLAASQYLKASILDREGSVNFLTRVYLGKYDDMSIKLLFDPSRERAAKLESALGAPGFAAIERLKADGSGFEMVTRQMPRVTDDQLAEWMQ